jgi:hypothetical protein
LLIGSLTIGTTICFVGWAFGAGWLRRLSGQLGGRGPNLEGFFVRDTTTMALGRDIQSIANAEYVLVIQI